MCPLQSFSASFQGVVQMKALGVSAMQSGVWLQFPVHTELPFSQVEAVLSCCNCTAYNHSLQKPLHFFLPSKLLLVQGIGDSKQKTGTPILWMGVEQACNGELDTQSVLAKIIRNCCISKSFLSFTLSPTCLNCLMDKYQASLIHADCVQRHFNEPVSRVDSDKRSCACSCRAASWIVVQ